MNSDLNPLLGREPAFPVDGPNGDHPGMTLRQHYAGLFMQAEMASSECTRSYDKCAKDAVAAADALIAELSK